MKVLLTFLVSQIVVCVATGSLVFGGPLHKAAGNGKLDEVKRLVKAGEQVNEKMDLMGTPLHMAVLKNHPVIVEYLLESGAKVDSTTNQGFTPLYFAANKGHVAVAEILLSHGANVNHIADAGMPIISVVAYQGHIEMAKLLIKKGANVGKIDKEGNTAMFYAESRGHQDMIQLINTYERENRTKEASVKEEPTPNLRVYTNKQHGFSFHYSSHLEVFSPDEVVKKTQGLFSPTKNAVIFVVDMQDPDRNLNIQIFHRESPTSLAKEDLKALARQMDKMYPDTIQGFQKVSARIFTVSQALALEYVFTTLRGETALKQRSIMVFPKEKNINLTFTTKAPDYEQIDKTFFLPIISSFNIR